MTVSVLIADDQPLMRAALRMYLEAEPDFDVVGEAADGEEAVAVAERLQRERGIDADVMVVGNLTKRLFFGNSF